MEKIIESIASAAGAAAGFLTALDYGMISGRLLSAVKSGNPWVLLGLFLVSSLTMVWRLNAIERKGFEGTAVGTLIMPYCSGFANLAFAYVMATRGGAAGMVLENCIVNNVTNLTLLLGTAALIWRLQLYPGRVRKQNEKLAHLSLVLTLIAILFFTSVTWVLAGDGGLSRGDGLVLVGLFLFWQLFEVFEVLKTNVRKKRSVSRWVALDLAAVGAAAWGTYHSIEGLVSWVGHGGGGVIPPQYLGLASGLLMVVPNGLLAFYYSAAGRTDIACASQTGDAHICIPLCIGVYAIFTPVDLPATFTAGIWIILAAALVHLLLLGFLGRLPRPAGALLVAGYAFFMYTGIVG